MSPMDNRFLVPRAKGDADALAYIAAVEAADGESLESGVKAAYTAFVVGCKSDGIWDAIKASCIMAGARTISGALVPLKRPYGAELVDIENLPTPTIYDFDGSVGAWDATSRTMSNTAQTAGNTGFPRFGFAISGISTSKRYRVTARITGDIAAVVQLRLATSGGTPVPYSDDGTGGRVFDGVITPTSANYVEFTINGFLAVPKSARIESLSIREDSFTPTPYNFTASDYSRTTGIKGDGSTTYLDSNRANDADGQDDNHNAVYVTDAQVGSLFVSGVGVTGINYIDANTSSSARVINRDGSITVSGTIGSGTYASSRSDSAEYGYFTPQGSGTQAGVSVAPNALNVLAFVRSDGSTLSSYSTARLAFYSIGSAIPDLAALDARVSTLISSISTALS